MCELFALNAAVPTPATHCFAGLSARGGRTGDHADGFGMAFHDGEVCRLFIDDAPACRSSLAEWLQRSPIPARTVLAHVRKATQGRVALVNCHPFQREWAGRHWVFAHHGDLRDFAPPLDGSFLPLGQTGSERAFCWLMQQLRTRFRHAPLPDGPALAEALAPWIARIAAHGAFNMLLGDGRSLLAHASTQMAWLERAAPFRPARLVDLDLEIDLASLHGPDERIVLVATAPLTAGEPWVAFAPGELRVFSRGRCMWSGSSRTSPSALQACALPA